VGEIVKLLSFTVMVRAILSEGTFAHSALVYVSLLIGKQTMIK